MQGISGTAIAAFAVALSVATGAAAQEPTFGERYFMTNCAMCHGTMGAGDGPMAEFFAQRPSSLRDLTTNNDGVYPFDEVYASIDGRNMMRAHGSQMPVWGDAFSVEAAQMYLPNRETAEEIVHARILSIVYFVQTLQH